MDECLKGFLFFVSFRPTLFLGSSSGAIVRRDGNLPGQVDGVISNSQVTGFCIVQVTRDKLFTCHTEIHESSVQVVVLSPYGNAGAVVY